MQTFFLKRSYESFNITKINVEPQECDKIIELSFECAQKLPENWIDKFDEFCMTNI